jgi:hypothetical protein
MALTDHFIPNNTGADRPTLSTLLNGRDQEHGRKAIIRIWFRSGIDPAREILKFV